MGHLHDPNDPRHARMFELLRQRELAKTTARRVKTASKAAAKAEVNAALRETAQASLKPKAGPIRRLLKLRPGSNVQS